MSFFKDGVAVTEIKWTAPTQNTDGSPIDYALTYNLYVDGVNVLNFPGSLNPDGRYSFPLDQVGVMQAHGSYTLELTAVAAHGAESAPSNAIVIEKVLVPNAPTAFSAE